MSTPNQPSVPEAAIAQARHRLARAESDLAQAVDWEQQVTGSLDQAKARTDAARFELEAAGLAVSILEPALIPGAQAYTPRPSSPGPVDPPRPEHHRPFG